MKLYTVYSIFCVLGLLLAGCPEEEPCVCDDDSAPSDDDDDATADDDDDSAPADDDDATSDDDDDATPGDDDDTSEEDADGDGYTPADGDCDDTDEEVYPGAENICGDDIDNDCDGIIDRGCRVYVPASEFLMGADEDLGGYDQHPQHAVYLDAYFIDVYEVTVAEYYQCELAGVCTHPRFDHSFARDSYYDNPDYEDYPVVYIRRDDARTYCDWVDGWLPTEAQWEKAARGDQDTRQYPWGDWYDCSHGNANWCVGETARIGSYPINVSPYGVRDMSGNVWEFFDDFYDPTYYGISPYENPTGPTTGNHLSYRGGAFTWWGNPTVNVRHPARELGSSFYNIGFRCAYDHPM